MTSYDNIESLGMEPEMQSWDSANSPMFSLLIDHVKPKTIIEVGSWKGVSACVMAELSEPYGTKIHCVDTWLGSVEHFITGTDKLPRDEWGYPRLFHQFLTNVKKTGYADRITPHPMPSNDGAKWLKHQGITAQLIYIDGDHSLEGCYQDMVSYWPLLDKGGIMFGDDFFVFTSVAAAALRFTCERDLNLETEKPFWIIRK